MLTSEVMTTSLLWSSAGFSFWASISFSAQWLQVWTTKTLRNMKFVVTWGPQGDRWPCRHWGERRSSRLKGSGMHISWGTERGLSEMLMEVLCRYKTLLAAQVLFCWGRMFVFFFWWIGLLATGPSCLACRILLWGWKARIIPMSHKF